MFIEGIFYDGFIRLDELSIYLSLKLRFRDKIFIFLFLQDALNQQIILKYHIKIKFS